MEIASFIISIIAIVVTVWSFIRQYFYKKEGVLLTISDALVVDDKLRVLLLYTNIGNQMSTITNASIQLGEDEKISLEYLNHQVRCQWITPFTLSEKEQKCLIIYYPLSDFKMNVTSP